MAYFYSGRLFLCTKTKVIKREHDKKREVIIRALDLWDARADIKDVIIVKKPTNKFLNKGYNYAEEILTGVRIPIMSRWKYDYNRAIVDGNIAVPYCAALDFGADQGLITSIPAYSEVNKSEEMYEYIELHTDSNGSVESYKTQLLSLIEDSKKNFKELTIINEDTPESIYKDFQRNRRR